jgi:hypothetical protein
MRTVILEPHGKLNGELVRTLIGIKQFLVVTTLELDPLQCVNSVENVILSLY